MTSGHQLSPAQRALLDRWLPGATVEQDHSWGLVGTTVLELSSGGAHFIAKAGDDKDQHIARELHAHRHWLAPWTSRGRAAELVNSDDDSKLILTRYLPGELVLGTANADDPATYRQAGELLSQLHSQSTEPGDDWEKQANERSLAWLDGPHRIAAGTVERLRAEIAGWSTPPVRLVPTHGDWQPRNWLVHDGVPPPSRSAWQDHTDDLDRPSRRCPPATAARRRAAEPGRFSRPAAFAAAPQVRGPDR